MTRRSDAPGAPSRLRAVLVLHFCALVAVRLVYEADDFNNWDLISLLNATAFPSVKELLDLPEVHFKQPFAFPLYQTGAESVSSLLIHRFVAPFSFYWSSAAVLLVYDLIFLFALYRLLGLVFDEYFLECVAWMLAAMSPVILTFLSISAFDTQAFATLVVALLGSEYVLQSHPVRGGVLLVLAFACISQAYGLTFFLPVFCLVWAAARSLLSMAGASGDADGPGPFFRNLTLLITVVLACTLGVEHLSQGGYSHRALAVVSGPYLDDIRARGPVDVPDRLGVLVRAAFEPARIRGIVYPAFAPFVILTVLVVYACAPLAKWLRSARRPQASIAAPTRRAPALLAAIAWLGLVAFGYLPGVSGGTLKSQRCVFGDIFLVMAVVALVRSLTSRGIVRRGTVLAQLLVFLCVSDAYYLFSLARVDHTRNHFPLFDYDTRDSIVRHDLISVIERMRQQATNENAGLVIYYPRGRDENRTDPAVFFGRFLRHFGSYRDSNELVFACRFCDVAYGCPFPEVKVQACANRCCYQDPLEQIALRQRMGGRTIYLWWHSDPVLPDEPRRAELLAAAARTYRIEGITVPAAARSWSCYRLTPLVHGRLRGETWRLATAAKRSERVGPPGDSVDAVSPRSPHALRRYRLHSDVNESREECSRYGDGRT